MTDYNELAQRIVAQGILKYHGPAYFLMPDYTNIGTAREACNDGRVVLAALNAVREKTTTDLYYIFTESLNLMDDDVPTAIAIVLACLDALETDKCN